MAAGSSRSSVSGCAVTASERRGRPARLGAQAVNAPARPAGPAPARAATHAAAVDLGRPPPTWRWRALCIGAALLLVLGVALPLPLAVVLGVVQGFDPVGWQALWLDGQTLPAWRLSVGTALLSTALAAGAALALGRVLFDRAAWTALVPRLAAMLAVPHAAAAIGLLWLLMPAGGLARLLAAPLGWTEPPDWRIVNDPAGLSLVLALVLKELPFLLWMLAAAWARAPVREALRGQLRVGRSLGLDGAALGRCVLGPAAASALRGPVLAVFAYGLTGVDMALVIGPGSPPTLAVLAWQALQDAAPERHAQGVAAALLLGLTLVATVVVAQRLEALWRWIWLRRLRGGVTRAIDRPRDGAGRDRTGRDAMRPATSQPDPMPPIAATRGGSLDRTPGRTPELPFNLPPDLSPPRAIGQAHRLASAGAVALGAIYLLLIGMLLLASLAGVWTFPALWPTGWSAAAWVQAGAAGQAADLLLGTALLAAAAALLALGLALLWLETAPPAWDGWAVAVASLPLWVPALLWLAGLQPLALRLQLDGSWPALAWLHALMALPYVLATLLPAWRTADPHHAAVALALGLSRVRTAWRVRWPLQAAPLATALAVAVAVSVGQYLPTQYLGAGHIRTVTTEAVTLAAGGQRRTAAVQALLQAVLPLLAFAVAGRVGRRWERSR